MRGPQGRGPDPWRGEPEAHAARVRAGWRLPGAAVRLEFDEQIQDGDTCVENLGVKLLVDPMSVHYSRAPEIALPRGSRARSL